MGVKAGKLYGEVVPDPSVARVPYDGAKLKGHIEGFSTPLFTHVSFYSISPPDADIVNSHS